VRQRQLLVALGPGDPELIPLASFRALETAGPVRVEPDEPLAGWLGRQGLALAGDAPVAAASGERFVRLQAAAPDVPTVPDGDALAALMAGDAMIALMRLTARLRRDCPWDREQTALTIVPHTLEEAYEVAEAAQLGDPQQLLDELGDLLFQTAFLALLLSERDEGDWAATARAITAKLIRRHPHVFGETVADTPGQVRRNWEQIKSDQEGRSGIFHDVPSVLPALLHARKVQRRASAVGFDWHAWDGAWGDLA
jgi:NTP pyrophosphatase (non-canonical NTP hydrolase)